MCQGVAMANVALGCADPHTLFPGHFGESPGFVIVDLGGARSAPQWRPNPWASEPIETRPPKIAELLHDCEAVIMRAIAKQGLAQLSRRFDVYRAPDDDVPSVLATLAGSGLSAYRRFDPESGKFSPAEA